MGGWVDIEWIRMEAYKPRACRGRRAEGARAGVGKRAIQSGFDRARANHLQSIHNEHTTLALSEPHMTIMPSIAHTHTCTHTHTDIHKCTHTKNIHTHQRAKLLKQKKASLKVTFTTEPESNVCDWTVGPRGYKYPLDGGFFDKNSFEMRNPKKPL